MPLHDWTDERGWDGVHLLWISELLHWIKPRLPEGYRAFVGSVPALTVDAPNGHADVRVRQWSPPTAPPPPSPAAASDSFAPDTETVATFTLDAHPAVHIEHHGWLIAAVELVSPRNKDRPSSRDRYLTRFAGYLRLGVHLVLIDVLPRPLDFSFADAIAANLGWQLETCRPPHAVSFRVGEAVPEGTLMAAWRRPLRVGEPLPSIPLALNLHQVVPLDLETTYARAAAAAYLD